MQATPTPPANTPRPQTTVQTAPPPSGPFTAREMYEAAQAQRRLLRDQLSSTESDREEVAQQLRQPNVSGADKEGLEAQIRLLDTRVLDLRQQLADAQLRESQTAGVPGATAESPQSVANERFEMMLVGGVIITLALGIPLVLGYSRRLWKRAAVTLSMTPELDRRLDSIDRAIETTALEVERIGEGQRFVTQLMAQRANAERLPVTAEPETREP